MNGVWSEDDSHWCRLLLNDTHGIFSRLTGKLHRERCKATRMHNLSCPECKLRCIRVHTKLCRKWFLSPGIDIFSLHFPRLNHYLTSRMLLHLKGWDSGFNWLNMYFMLDKYSLFILHTTSFHHDLLDWREQEKKSRSLFIKLQPVNGISSVSFLKSEYSFLSLTLQIKND